MTHLTALRSLFPVGLLDLSSVPGLGYFSLVSVQDFDETHSKTEPSEQREMDERKRGFDVAAELNDQKRPRPSGDSIGLSPSDVVSKICLSRGDFGKVIGKGGQTIANIRGKCGAAIKGTEVSEEKRLVFSLLTFPSLVDFLFSE
jgi:predicted RNA-binding protein YlqC (UPF0109 family)